MDTVKPGILKPVQSSNVAAIGHDTEGGDFFVQWKDGRVSCYGDVPAETAEQVLKADSVGKAVRSILAINFKHRYVTREVPANG